MTDDKDMTSKYNDIGGTSEASERIRAEIVQLKELNTKELGFTAEPYNNDLYHWHVHLFGFGHQTKLGQVYFCSTKNNFNPRI
jgi:ubiquitin-protein ligase